MFCRPLCGLHNHYVSCFYASIGCVAFWNSYIQLMLTRTLSSNVIAVALLVSYLLLFNVLLAGCGDTVIFLQSTDNCMPTSVH